MLRKDDYSKSDWIKEFLRLWEDMVKAVYLKESKDNDDLKEMVELGWEQTKYTPLQYVEHCGSPYNITNMIDRGQKSREQRWEKWINSKKI